jgi:ribosomal protein S18 acetylase RimI-like enzyme
LIRRLGPGDEAILSQLAREDADFDLDERSVAATPLGDADAAAYLTDPHVLHWIAEEDARVAGFLVCHVLRMRSKQPLELVLYEIGVHRDMRRRGIGRALLDECVAWMRERGIHTIWVLADNSGAEAFYLACRFIREREQPTMFVRVV